MKEIPLSQGYVALIDDEDYERVASRTWCADVRRHKDGSIACVYAGTTLSRKIGGSSLLLHRFIMGVTERRVQVDHQDHDGLNCQKNNLRLCSQTQNQANTRKPQRRKWSQYKGVSQERGRWFAYICSNYRQRRLGYFITEVDAAKAYDTAARELWGQFACTNFAGNT